MAESPVRVEPLMGTVISIDMRDREVLGRPVEEALAWLHQVDRRFSPFRADSEISLLGSGRLTIDDCHPDVATVLAVCEDLRAQTGGVFNAWGWRADGRLDPSGVVKGWAVERAAEILMASGARNFCINAGGDIVVRGRPQPGRAWRIGIRHPSNAAALAAVLQGQNLAVATSGAYERGDHIVNARSGAAARGLLSLTVAGPSLALADAYATAAFAMGRRGVAFVAAQPGYAVYAVTAEARVQYSSDFATLLVADRLD
jgi:FAD:protein FMN transferase